jgi:ABC-type transport system substrate-binding protein
MIDRAPFDRIALDDKEQSLWEVELLDLPNRKVPEQPRASSKLRVRLLSRPGEEFDVKWGDIERVELYEQLVLQEAAQLVAAGKFDEAYPYYAFLLRNFEQFPGVKEATSKFLFEDAKGLARRGEHLEAWGVLQELRAHDAGYDGLQRAMVVTVGKLIEQHVQAERFWQARPLWRQLQELYPTDEVVKNWQARLEAMAQAQVDLARARLAEGDGFAAHQACAKAVRIWPDLAAARELATELNRQRPFVTVGVRRLAPLPGACLEMDPAWQRWQRLVQRTLSECVAYSPDQVQFACPFGTLESTNLGIELNWRLRNDVLWPQRRLPLGPADVARTLLWLANPVGEVTERDWAELVERVEVTGSDSLSARLRRPALRPEAMLTVPVAPWDWDRQSSEIMPGLGPYVRDMAVNQPDRQQYSARAGYFAAGARQPQLLAEQRLDAPDDAIHALKEGRVQVIDRMLPWEQRGLAEQGGVSVVAYARPTLCLLWLNGERPLLKQRAFRRALVYGVPREGILKEKLLRGQTVAGTQTISGPLPVGYAYNPQVEDWPYEPRLAMTLAAAARSELAPKPKEGDELPSPPTSEVKPLVLAHPADELSQVTCQAIQQHLGVVGIAVELKCLEPGISWPAERDFDLLYLEVTMSDPLVDLPRLLASGGITGRASPFMEQSLQRLSEATDYQAARQALWDVHRLAHDELSVIPLWQLMEFAAHDRSVAGLGTGLITLYQHVEQWSVDPWLPQDAQP